MFPTGMTTQLMAALTASFPPRPITRALLEEPTAAWEEAKTADVVAQVDGKTWAELDAAFVERHDSALRYAGDSGFVALLPAYLHYLLTNPAFNQVPFIVAGELKRYGGAVIERIFDARIERLTAEQRSAVKQIISYLTTRDPMESAMSAAFESYWRLQE